MFEMFETRPHGGDGRMLKMFQMLQLVHPSKAGRACPIDEVRWMQQFYNFTMFTSLESKEYNLIFKESALTNMPWKKKFGKPWKIQNCLSHDEKKRRWLKKEWIKSRYMNKASFLNLGFVNCF